MTFSDKLIALRKKAGWSQEELAERLNVSRQSVSKWESAQSMPDIDKILQLSSLFSVTTDCLLKDTQDDPQPAAAQTPSPLPRVTLAQAEDYLTKAQANAPQMALATALCIVSPIPLLALGTVSSLSGMLMAGFVAGMFATGGQSVLYALAPLFYSTQIRATGVGTAVAVGRLGAMSGPLLAGKMLALGTGTVGVMAASAPGILLAGLAVFILMSRKSQMPIPASGA